MAWTKLCRTCDGVLDTTCKEESPYDADVIVYGNHSYPCDVPPQDDDGDWCNDDYDDRLV